MGKILYMECNGGISGDMTVAMLLDLGAEERVLRQVLQSLPVSGYEVAVRRVKKSGIDCCDFLVELDAAHENHDYDMEYLHGKSGCSEHHHAHGQTHGEGHHAHGHTHEEGHHHVHEHRGMAEITDIMEKADMTSGAKVIADKIFRILAEGESKAHGVPVEQVHFHEVGAVDSIVDIVGVAVCLDNLGITEVIVPKLCEGRGTVRCQHGVLPVPVPAVANIMEAYKLPVEFIPVEGEFVTPTGAAIVAAVKTGEVLPDTYYIEKAGMGAGKRTYERPSILRGMLLSPAGKSGHQGFSGKGDIIYKLECNMDDCTGENLGYVMEILMEEGARDVHYLPVMMKKNRPAYQLNVICTKEKLAAMEEIIFRETTTIGIRRQEMERSILERQVRRVVTPYGEAEVKVCLLEGEERVYPEYESVKRLCRTSGKAYGEIVQAILAAVQD